MRSPPGRCYNYDNGPCANQHQIVPVLIHLATADVGFQLELKVATCRVHFVFPLWTDVLTENHYGVDDVEPIRLLSDHAFLFQEFAGLGHMIPQLPERLYGGETCHFVSCI